MAIMNSYRFLISSLLFSTLAFSGCSNQSENSVDNMGVTGVTVANGDMVVTASQLSDRIIKQLNDYALFDIRNTSEFEKGHIKTAQQARVAQLLSDSHNLDAGKDIILYSIQSDKAAQLATLLRIKGINAFFLSGGYNHWQQQLNNVEGNAASSSEAQQMAKQQAISCWFEGDYVASAGLAPKVSPATEQTQAGGYVPPLEPATHEETDALGLGLDIGLGPEEQSDELGLGLGLGLGPEEAPAAKKKHKLNIGEGC